MSGINSLIDYANNYSVTPGTAGSRVPRLRGSNLAEAVLERQKRIVGSGDCPAQNIVGFGIQDIRLLPQGSHGLERLFRGHSSKPQPFDKIRSFKPLHFDRD